jgi:hypothetical protein
LWRSREECGVEASRGVIRGGQRGYNQLRRVGKEISGEAGEKVGRGVRRRGLERSQERSSGERPGEEARRRGH